MARNGGELRVEPLPAYSLTALDPELEWERFDAEAFLRLISASRPQPD